MATRSYTHREAHALEQGEADRGETAAGMTDASAGVDCRAWERGGVAAHGAGTAARRSAACRCADGVRRKRSRAKGLAFRVQAGARGVGLDRWPQPRDRRSLG